MPDINGALACRRTDGSPQHGGASPVLAGVYVGVCLLEAGYTLEKAAPHGPDHRVLLNGRRLLVECIAPEAGEAENRAETTILSWTKTELGSYPIVAAERRRATSETPACDA